MLPVWALVFYVSGLYGRRAARTLHTEMSRLFRALVVCALSLAVAVVVFRLAFVSRPLLGLFLLLNAVGVVVGRGLVRAVILDSAVRRRVLVAGGLDEVRAAAASVETHADWGLELLGVVSDGTWSAAHLAADDGPRWRVLGTYEDIPALTARDHHVIDEVLIAPSGRRLHDLQSLEPVFLALEEQGIVTRLVVNFLPRSLSGLSFDELGGLPLLTFSTAPHDEVVLFVRRAVELRAGQPAADGPQPGARGDRHRHQARLAGPGAVPAAALRPARPAVHLPEVPLDAGRRRGAQEAARALQRDGRAGVQDDQRPAGHAARPLPAPHEPRRAAAALEHHPRRHEHRRPAAGGARGSASVRAVAAAPAVDEARAHLPLAGQAAATS